MTENPTPAHAGLDLGELARLHLVYSETRAAYEASPRDATMWPHARAMDDLHRAARNAMPELLDRAARADTLAREAAAKDAEIAALKEALEPFAAEWNDCWCPEQNAGFQVGDDEPLSAGGVTSLTAGDLRRAARLAPANGEKGPDDHATGAGDGR